MAKWLICFLLMAQVTTASEPSAKACTMFDQKYWPSINNDTPINDIYHSFYTNIVQSDLPDTWKAAFRRTTSDDVLSLTYHEQVNRRIQQLVGSPFVCEAFDQLFKPQSRYRAITLGKRIIVDDKKDRLVITLVDDQLLTNGRPLAGHSTAAIAKALIYFKNTKGLKSVWINFDHQAMMMRVFEAAKKAGFNQVFIIDPLELKAP